MRKMRASGAFTHGPYTRRGTLEPFIHPYIATRVGFHAGVFQRESLRVRDTSCSHEQVGAFQGSLGPRSAYPDRVALPGQALDVKNLEVKQHFNAFILEQVEYFFGN